MRWRDSCDGANLGGAYNERIAKMGQRANLVIVRRHTWSLYYDHWCANRLDIELFWGPRLAADFIEQREPRSDRNDWLDEVWCEGAVVLDEDRKALVWYGGEDIGYDIPRRRAFLDLMKCQWQGWEIRWATGSIVEIGCYLGLPADKFLVDTDLKEGFTVLTEDPEANDTLLTVRRQGQRLAARIYGDEEALELGSSQFTTLLQAAREPSLVWTGNMPTGGLHIDVDARSLRYWRAKPVAGIEDRVRRGWSGWQTEWLEDYFEEHLRIASMDIQLPHQDISDLQRGELRRIRESCTHLASNPARRISAAMFKSAQVNPLTDVNRSSAGSETEKLRLLDILESRSPIRHD
jgi:hypothetical protein